MDDEFFSKEQLKKHIQYLASDELKGRKTNEPGYLKAAEYVADYCSEIGLYPLFKDSMENSNSGWFQQVQFIDYKMGVNNWLAFNDGKKFYPDKGYFLMNSGDANGPVSIDSILFAGCAIHEPELGWNDFEGIDINGKYVMMVDGIPDENNFPELNKKHEQSHISLALKIEKLNEMGAAGLIVVSEASRKFWKLSARINQKLGYKPVEPSFWADPFHSELPVIMIHPDIFTAYFPTLNFVLNEDNYPQPFYFNSNIQLSFDISNRFFSAPNVAGYISGSDYENEEVIILSAHLDHIGSDGNEIFNGANDNASSCSVLLEIAKELVNNPPKRTVIFVFYTAEEPCLWGSQYFIYHYNSNKENILVNINVEMCGKRDKGNRGTTAIGPVQFEKYFRNSEPLAINYLDCEQNKQRYSGSDQLSFYRNNIPAIRFGNLDYLEKHTSRDDISIINFDYMLSFAETLLTITYEIAND
jgi:hypothetical protein